MPYQGSTQSVGFRNRAVSDSKVSQAESKAQALEKRRVQQVNEMEKVSASQLAEMTRQDKQLTANDEYEIKNLAKFSKSLNEALEARELVKIKFGEFKSEKKQLANKLANLTNCHIVTTIGHIVILFRQNQDINKQKYKIDKYKK